MILYNGATGGLGRYFEGALAARDVTGHALVSRLEDREGLRSELARLPSHGDALLVQMAARVVVSACEADPEGTLRTNVANTVATVRDFVEWAESRSLLPRILYVSSGHVYTARPRGSRIRESDSTAPRSVYARSKLLAEQEVCALASSRGFRLIVARVFGLIAPRQPPSYLLPGLVRRVWERRIRDIPGLSYVRDYLDARDVCENLLALGGVGAREAWEGEVVNVCSGQGVTLREILREVVRALRPTEEAALMGEAAEAPGRPDDVPWIVGDPSRFMSLTGEDPRRISLQETVRAACASN